jgi:hypothetical protein
MSEPMQVWVEVWPVAADKQGIWLCSGSSGAWRETGPVYADHTPSSDAELLAAHHGARDVALFHSTSWREEPPRTVVTFVAVLKLASGSLVLDAWPAAAPIDPAGLTAVAGPAASWSGSDSPPPRDLDVVLHAVRHLAFLNIYDPPLAAVFPDHWREHLSDVAPALAGLYRSPDGTPSATLSRRDVTSGGDERSGA